MRSHGYAAVGISLLAGVAFSLFAALNVSPEKETSLAGPRDIEALPDAIPKREPLSRKGNASSYVVWGQRYTTLKSAKGYVEEGVASWYGPGFQGRQTANGEVYDMYQMTAAHRSLPLPTYVSVKNLRNGRSVIVRVNDRGPFYDERVVDVSLAAATKLGFAEQGTTRVELRAIDPETWRQAGTTSVVGAIEDDRFFSPRGRFLRAIGRP